jgi:putative transcriptional regulator
MRKQYRSPLMASVHETAEGPHAAGVMDTRTMREFDELCLTPVRPLKPKSAHSVCARAPARRFLRKTMGRRQSCGSGSTKRLPAS